MYSMDRTRQQNVEPWSNERVSRRSLLKRGIVAAFALPAMPALLAACGDDGSVSPEDSVIGDEPVDAADDDDDLESDEPEAHRGGTLRVGYAGSVDTFDPHHPVQFEGIWIQGVLYSGLVRIRSGMEIMPDLATSWESNEDATVWTFHLRDDAMFHHDRAVTAEDVKHSLERLIDPDEATVVAGQLTMIDHAEATGEFEVDVHLNSPYVDFPLLCGSYFMRIVPIEVADTLDVDPVGSGPYKLQSHSPGERTVLERFEDYHLSESEGYLDTVEYITIGEDTSRVTALAGGTIDLISEVPPASLPMLEGADGIVLEESQTGSYQPICMHVNDEPFDDVRVRQAMKLVIERDDYIQSVVQGFGVPANDHPVPSFDPMHAELPQRQRNVEEAISLLADAGYPDGIDIELHTSSGRVGLQEAALTFQEMAQDANIRVEVTNHPIDSFWAEVYMQRPFFMSNWGGEPMADQALAAAHFEGSGWNETRWHDPEFEELVLLARETPDEDERRELFRQALEIVSNDGASIIPYFLTMSGAWSERVHGYEMHPLRMVDIHEVWVEGDHV